MQKNHEFIVVGSGPSGASAAQTLIEAGKDTAMLDVGFTDQVYRGKIPERDFLSLRKEDYDQHAYFLGKQFEGIARGKIKTGPQITPPRIFVTEGVEKWLPISSKNFDPMQSLAYGGLGAAWGLACFTFSSQELKQAGLDETQMSEAYQVVAKRIGISGAHDDASPYVLRTLADIQSPTRLEHALEEVSAKYRKYASTLNEHGIFLGRTGLALLSKNLGDRQATQYGDMDFWDNPGRSAYRPEITVDELKQQPNFAYYGGRLVMKFSEVHGVVTVTVKKIDTGEEELFTCKKLILAAGVLSTARIAIRSFDYQITKLPILCGNYSYFPCLMPGMLGKDADEKKISYSPLALFYDKERSGIDVATAMLYTYRSLLSFRLAKELPFGFADSVKLLSQIYPSLLIAGVHHPGTPSPEKYIELTKDSRSVTGDVLRTTYQQTDKEVVEDREREKEIKKALRKIGCYPLKRVHPGFGASIHYGGTMPFGERGEQLSLSSDGRLEGTEHVYVADGSGFRYMPAKGPTFTLMANAHLVACHALT